MSYESIRRQQGVTLLVGLIMVLLITIVGMSAIRSSGLQEQMAGNLRDRNVAFQAAEAALREGESFVAGGQVNVPIGENAGFLESLDRPGQLFWTTPAENGGFDWDDGALTANYSKDVKHTKERPKYVVEQVSFIEAGVYGGATDFTSLQDMEPEIMYRVTSRAVGASENTVVILQSTAK